MHCCCGLLKLARLHWPADVRPVLLLALALSSVLPLYGQLTNGAKTIGIFRPGDPGSSAIWVVDSNGDHTWEPSDLVYLYGIQGDIPVMGDWTFSGQRRLGIFRNGYWVVDSNDSRSYDAGDYVFTFGVTGDKPLTIYLSD